MSDQSDLRNFQRSLNENDDEKNHYLSNQILLLYLNLNYQQK